MGEAAVVTRLIITTYLRVALPLEGDNLVVAIPHKLLRFHLWCHGLVLAILGALIHVRVPRNDAILQLGIVN
uniref:Uncharacterized protein n=1 Tax=Lutzomyia longipalpis TaxID=7200 RepID=A0A1B0CF36_LUTLO